MIREIRPALSLVVLFTIALGFIIPGIFTQVAQTVFPFQAGGSLIMQKGRPVASGIIGQNFTGPAWFNPRPSALMGTDAKGNAVATPYDDSESGASNLAPTSATLLAAIKSRIASWHKTYGAGSVPADAVTSSGSGVDPDISLANALAQAPVVANARHLPVEDVVALVNRIATQPALGFIGTTNVNVVQLNLALAEMK
ncbi:potassium-transporting ATPase subunit KdpC [Acidisoma cellulosilytica]|uniref:Potassium-transporting ATPase KdpC subunit n=1 Tax=Acidisoma cellulosilyticum TaxID=2802395 RepID=A0A963Z485_9PROT|nr:potassium-transporting ATPase subunit KdpC [Acidisoma cellulosilyticum]MCB8881637.1 potassium-transporting ATPase subunit KdpC [Acidisoma cellulosilyticum]